MSIKIGKFLVRPEVEKPVYWLHIMVIIILFNLLSKAFGYDVETLWDMKNVYLGLIFALSDIITHTTLGMD